MRAVALYATGGITISKLEAMKSNANTRLTFPALIPPISDSEIRDKMVRASHFSARGWAAPTRSMMKLCRDKINDDDMVAIIDKATEISRASRRQAREAESDFDPDDSILQLGNGSEHSSDEGTTE